MKNRNFKFSDFKGYDRNKKLNLKKGFVKCVNPQKKKDQKMLFHDYENKLLHVICSSSKREIELHSTIEKDTNGKKSHKSIFKITVKRFKRKIRKLKNIWQNSESVFNGHGILKEYLLVDPTTNVLSGTHANFKNPFTPLSPKVLHKIKINPMLVRHHEILCIYHKYGTFIGITKFNRRTRRFYIIYASILAQIMNSIIDINNIKILLEKEGFAPEPKKSLRYTKFKFKIIGLLEQFKNNIKN